MPNRCAALGMACHTCLLVPGLTMARSPARTTFPHCRGSRRPWLLLRSSASFLKLLMADSVSELKKLGYRPDLWSCQKIAFYWTVRGNDFFGSYTTDSSGCQLIPMRKSW
ncbi:hypothetical protein RHIZ404_200007 [Rhizobium sp. EC-SD404]|nr:hypothetical protein RHIZ404_200007 [Rhizobium sp. EC-SD404]